MKHLKNILLVLFFAFQLNDGICQSDEKPFDFRNIDKAIKNAEDKYNELIILDSTKKNYHDEVNRINKELTDLHKIANDLITPKGTKKDITPDVKKKYPVTYYYLIARLRINESLFGQRIEYTYDCKKDSVSLSQAHTFLNEKGQSEQMSCELLDKKRIAMPTIPGGLDNAAFLKLKISVTVIRNLCIKHDERIDHVKKHYDNNCKYIPEKPEGEKKKMNN